jgi:hypothetical protein
MQRKGKSSPTLQGRGAATLILLGGHVERNWEKEG